MINSSLPPMTDAGHPPHPWLADANAALDRGDIILAARLLETHNAVLSTDHEALGAYSRMMGLRGRHADAIAALDRAIERNPDQFPQLAIARAKYALHIHDTQNADYWFALAWQAGAREDGLHAWFDVLVALNRLPDAIEIARTLSDQKPDNAECWFWLGYVLQCAEQFVPARAAYERCLQLNPARAMLHSNLAALAVQEFDHPRARIDLEQVLRDEPDNGYAWANYASTLHAQRELQDALVAAERSLAVRTDIASAWLTYSNICKDFGRWDVARQAADQAAAMNPADQRYRWAVAMLQLAQGDYEAGWVSHESRWHGSKEMRHLSMPSTPQWTGQPLRGKTLMVWGEQGYGDVLQFIRFLPALANFVLSQGGELDYQCFDSLHPLMARSFPDLAGRIHTALVGRGVAHDYHLPLASLPLVLGVRFDTLAQWPAPYLRADAQRVAAQRKQFASRGNRLRVGLNWSGSTTHQRNPFRSIDPATLAQTLAGIEGAEFYCLQQNAETALGAMRANGLAITDDSAEWKNFDDTAAYVSALDLVITTCTAMAHLCGALGVPTWLMLDSNPHWVWMWDRRDTPWYASLTLYRQPGYQQWGPPLAQLAADLSAKAQQKITQSL